MANETIYGCVDWDDEGKVKFYQNDGCCEYIGCIEWTGIHAGQVAVTINTTECSDVYYACIDWVSGKFQVIVPDNCCDSGEDGDIICGDCCRCWPEHQTPIHYSVMLSGIVDCGAHNGSIANGSYVLTNADCWYGGLTCSYTIDTGSVRVNFSIGSGAPETPYALIVTAFTFDGVEGWGQAFAYGTEFSDCSDVFCGGDNNTIINCLFDRHGKDGSCIWRPHSWPIWEENTSYGSGNYVFHDGELYKCIQGHTSCSGGCPDPDEPGSGDQWQNYWEVSTDGCS